MEAFFTFASKLDGLHLKNIVVNCCALGIDQWIMEDQVHFIMKDASETKESLGDGVKHVSHVHVDIGLVGLAIDPSPILG